MPEESSATSLSVVIITLNEANNLKRLVPTVPKGAEIVVLDSHSQDETTSIATSFGARVESRAFDHFGAQKNAALALASRPWVLALDADEVPNSEMWQEILRVVAENEDAFWRIPRQLFFLGRSMRFGKTKDAPVRLFKCGSAVYRGDIHESISYIKSFPVRTLAKGNCAHYSYKDISDYFVRFNRYTSMIALNHARAGVPAPGPAKLMARPFFEFFARYVIRFGFLDGYPGFVYALYSSVYAFTKYAKLREYTEAGRKS